MKQEPTSRRAATADAREGISRLQAGEDVKIDEMRRFIEMAEAAGVPGTAVIEVSTVGLLHPRIRTAKVHDARK